MMKKIAGILVLSMIAGCTPKGDGEDALLGRSVVDQAKREVAMVGTPRRVVSGFTYPYVSAWYVATGSGEAMVGMHPSSYSAMEYSILANLSPELLASSTGFIQQGSLMLKSCSSLSLISIWRILLLGRISKNGRAWVSDYRTENDESSWGRSLCDDAELARFDRGDYRC